MGHNFVVAHCRKVQTGVGLRNVADHNCRTAVYDRDMRPRDKQLPEYISHPERAVMNQGERCGGLAVLKNRTDRISMAALSRKPQRNAAAAIEIVVSASPEWFAEHNTREWQDYFRSAREFLGDRFGKDNLLHWAVHYDEKTPHLHALFVPIVQAETGAKYSSSSFLGGRTGLRDLQTEIARQVGKSFGLERGMEGSRARHTDQYTWASETTQERDNLAMERGALDLKAKEIAQDKQAFEEAKKRDLRGWSMPTPGVLESAKSYAKRVEADIVGTLAAATEVLTEAEKKAEKVLEEAKEEAYRAKLKANDSAVAAIHEARFFRERADLFDKLRDKVYATQSFDQLNTVKDWLGTLASRFQPPGWARKRDKGRDADGLER